MQFIALYGTLRRGQPSFHRLGLDRALRFEGTCHIPGKLYDLGGYPGLIDSAGSSQAAWVAGDLFRIMDVDIWPILDAFEHYDARSPLKGLYRRKTVRVRVGEGQRRKQAQTYVYLKPLKDAPLIESGDWLAYAEQRNAASRQHAGRRWFVH